VAIGHGWEMIVGANLIASWRARREGREDSSARFARFAAIGSRLRHGREHGPDFDINGVIEHPPTRQIMEGN
jgi:hypothetical protein